MKILVVDVAAESGGALTVLRQFYEEFKKDIDNEYCLCLSVVKLEPCSNLTVLNYPWVKHSWIHRLIFDFFVVKNLIKKVNFDKVISLQNIPVKAGNLSQSVFIHNAILLKRYGFSLFEEPRLWVNEHIISVLLKLKMKKSYHVIVQTHWMAHLAAARLNIDISQISVCPPKSDVDIDKYRFNHENFKNEFFYPANLCSYKNHILLFQAIDILIKKNILNFKVILTCSANQLPAKLAPAYECVKDYIIMAGNISHEQVLDTYTKSILVFLSEIESYGLPLKEAREIGTPILSISKEYSQELLKGYKKVNFFKGESQLAELIEKVLLSNGHWGES